MKEVGAMSDRALVTELTTLLDPQVTANSAYLEAVEVRAAGRRRLVRVIVDTDKGVSLDDVAALSRALSETLDGPSGSAILGEQPYTLEVTSPGVDRPLTQIRHWRKAIGRLVEVAPQDGEIYVGRVTGVSFGADPQDAPTVTLDVDGELREVPIATVVRAVVQVEFGRVSGLVVNDADEADEVEAEEAAVLEVDDEVEDDDEDDDDDDDENDEKEG